MNGKKTWQGSKNLQGQVLQLTSLVTGLAFGAVALLLPAGTAQTIFELVLIGLAASGFYDFGKLIGGTIPQSK